MHLSDLWFIAIAVLWAGYFVLEGFDFGVGILLPVLGRDQARRRIMINAIGPTWDGNEVWLLTAGGAMFAAFPGWYASMFSAFYLPLLLILVALIIRGVAFEYRGKRGSAAWRRSWDTAIFVGSLLPAILWGVAFGNVLHGIPLNAAHDYAGNFFTMLNPYSLLGGLATLTLFAPGRRPLPGPEDHGRAAPGGDDGGPAVRAGGRRRGRRLPRLDRVQLPGGRARRHRRRLRDPGVGGGGRAAGRPGGHGRAGA